jgi:hypothetical protein
MAYTISVGVFDWVNFPRQQGFYPDDIPEEWKLAFYSNEFNSACLSLTALSSQVDLLSDWVSDLPDEFELSIYIEQSNHIPIIQTLLQNEDCHLTALIVDQSGSNNLLHKENLPSVLSTEILIYEFNEIWTPMNTAVQNSRFAMLPIAENIRQYREWIEQWLKGSEQDSPVEDKTLWLQGADTSYQQLSEIRTLTELMGY